MQPVTQLFREITKVGVIAAVGFPYGLQAVAAIRCLAHSSCLFLNLRAAPNSSMTVAGMGPFVRTRFRKISASVFRFHRETRSVFLSCCLARPSAAGGGRPALNRLNMSLATAVVLFHRNCRNHIRGVDVVGVDVVGIDRNRFAVAFGVTAEIYGYFKSGPCCRGFGAGGGKTIQYFDGVDYVPLVG